MKNETSYRFLIIFVTIVGPFIVNGVVLDYTLYSQLLNEIENDQVDANTFNSANSSSTNTNKNSLNDRIIDHFNKNHQIIAKYNHYLSFPETERLRLKNLTRDMFEFGYDNYMKYAYPMDELDPIHCKGRGPDHLNPSNININDVLGDYSLSLVDSLSSLVVFGNSSEFKRACKLLIDSLNFDKDNTVQVFEATIRILGSLISAHLVIKNKEQPFGDMKLPMYNNDLLTLARDLGMRLLAAFKNENTDLPFPRVNLKNSLPSYLYNQTCTSGAGTLVLEFGMLSSLLNDPVFEQVARKAVDLIYSKRNNQTGLIGNQLNIQTADWLGEMSGLGAGIDSYFEYLLKSYVLFGNEQDLEKFEQSKESLKKYLRHGRSKCFEGNGHHPVYLNVNMNNGNILNNWIDSLQASYPSVQALDGDLEEAICFHAFYFAIWKKFGVLPERFNWNLKMPEVYFYPLRPEFAESTYFLYRSTRNPFYLHVAKLIAENIFKLTKVKCGFATVHDVLDKSLEDRMESFFLSETLKYLYLIFDKENYLNNKGELEYIFSTEGHMYPIKQAALLNVDKSNTNRNPSRKSKSKLKHQCNLKMSTKKYYDMRVNLPMKMKYFDELFEMVGVQDNLEGLLNRQNS